MLVHAVNLIMMGDVSGEMRQFWIELNASFITYR